jgi:hypothetical protein
LNIPIPQCLSGRLTQLSRHDVPQMSACGGDRPGFGGVRGGVRLRLVRRQRYEVLVCLFVKLKVGYIYLRTFDMCDTTAVFYL